MPIWSEILAELARTQEQGRLADFDGVRRKYLGQLHQHSGRNVILYASGWLQKSVAPTALVSIGDEEHPGVHGGHPRARRKRTRSDSAQSGWISRVGRSDCFLPAIALLLYPRDRSATRDVGGHHDRLRRRRDRSRGTFLSRPYGPANPAPDVTGCQGRARSGGIGSVRPSAAGVRRWARVRNLEIRFVASEGPSSHGTLYAGNRKTTVKDRKKEIGKGLFAKMLADLGIDRKGF